VAEYKVYDRAPLEEEWELAGAFPTLQMAVEFAALARQEAGEGWRWKIECPPKGGRHRSFVLVFEGEDEIIS
jgi:hypothetical protein